MAKPIPPLLFSSSSQLSCALCLFECSPLENGRRRIRLSLKRDMDRARVELERADEAWCAAASAARDVEQIVSFWADDAIVIPPGQMPIIGKNAIRNYVTASLKIPGFSIQWKTTQFTIARD